MSAVTPEIRAPSPPPTAGRPGRPRTASASSIVNRIADNLRPSASRNDSASSLSPGVGTPAVERLSIPSRPPNTRQSSENDVRCGVRTPVGADINNIPGASVTQLRAGQTNKTFNVHTDLLTSRSPYFVELFERTSPDGPSPSDLTFPELDEFAFALFVRWLYGAFLAGPSDFHTMQHYLCLYIVASRFRIERLKNEVMDVVRVYYRTANMTAPAYRLEYIYDNTDGPCPMRRFLVTTAAYRALCERDPKISESIKDVVAKGGDLAVDYAEALVRLHRDDLVDVRRSVDCAFHEHKESKPCKVRMLEPYQNP